jgi:hypothetical protein
MKAAIFAYAWGFVDEGVDELLSYLRDLGIGRVLVTSQYHAGFFMHPHNPKRKTHLLEDGVTYYHPDPAIHANTVIKPKIAKMCRDRDWYAHICDRAAVHDIQVSAWHVCMHNTRIGLLHPEATIQNVYGDSYPHALSPGHPDARAYVLASFHTATPRRENTCWNCILRDRRSGDQRYESIRASTTIFQAILRRTWTLISASKIGSSTLQSSASGYPRKAGRIRVSASGVEKMPCGNRRTV